jgi:hypothetical protein
MAKSKVVFKTNEDVMGYNPQCDPIAYDIKLIVKDSGKFPVQLSLTLIPPPPYIIEVPEKKTINASSITEAYVKLNKFLSKYNYQMRA